MVAEGVQVFREVAGGDERVRVAVTQDLAAAGQSFFI
jgi:hypothetical protein